MKRLVTTLIIVSISISAFAQKLQEVVYLKNGSVIKGTIIEQVPNEPLKIQTTDGSIIITNMDDVEKIVKENTRHKYPTLGYRGFVEMSFGAGETTSKAHFGNHNPNVINEGHVYSSFSTIHGCQIIPNLFVGVGIGAKYYYITRDYLGHNEVEEHNFTLPLFVDTRYDIVKKGISPFIDTRIGYATCDIEGFYLSSAVGVRLRHFLFSVGYDFQDNDGEKYHDHLSSVEIRLAFDWGSR